MFAVFHFLVVMLAVFFGLRWELLALDVPFDAMYRALVLESLRLLITVGPFLIVLFRWQKPGFRRQLWTIVLFLLALYLIYFSIFGSSGFVGASGDVIDPLFTRLLKPAKYLMFAVWGYFLLFALFVNVDRTTADDRA